MVVVGRGRILLGRLEERLLLALGDLDLLHELVRLRRVISMKERLYMFMYLRV